MREKRIFLWGNVNEMPFTVDTEFKVHCQDAEWQSRIQKIVNKKREELDPDYNHFMNIGYELSDRKYKPIHVKRYEWYDKSRKNPKVLEIHHDTLLEDKPLPFIEAEEDGFKIVIDTDQNFHITPPPNCPHVEYHIELMSIIVKGEIITANDCFGYHPGRISRLAAGIKKNKMFKITKIHYYENPNRYVPHDPNVKY